MPPAVTLADRMMWISGSLIFALVVFSIATVIHSAISRKDARKRIQGQPIRWWVSAMYFMGACYGAWVADNQRYYINEVVGGMGGMGLLVGLFAGNVHGSIRLRCARKALPEAGNDALLVKGRTSVTDRENPYVPPRAR
jgi:hypothetical protein